MTESKRVIFGGLARDCAHALPRILRSLEALGAEVDDWAYVFLENNSVDRTAKVLETFDRKHARGIFRSYGDLDKQITKRTERLAMLRNACIEQIFASERLAGFNYLIILDLDGANEIIDRKRLLELMDLEKPDWTAIFANQSVHYYDIWALRHPIWCPDDCWQRVAQRPATMSEKEAIERFIEERRIRIDPNGGFLRVQSAFGGLGLYRLQALRDCRYVGVDKQGNEICEHVSFNKALIAQGGKLFIDPKLLNGPGNQFHHKQMNQFTKWHRSFNRRVANIRQQAGR